MKKLIAIIDNPTANPPGHTIKEARAPYVPVASVCVLPDACEHVKAERRELALVMAAAPEMLAVLRRVHNGEDLTGPGDLAGAVAAVIKKAKGKPKKDLSARELLSALKGIDESEPLPKTCQTRLIGGHRITGKVVSWKHCTLEGCRGRCIGVRWPNGRLTWPCLKGCKWISKTKVRIQ